MADTRSLSKSIFGALVGNLVEWYDFSLYGFMTPVLAALFFPHQTPAIALLSTYLLLAASFLMRPIGAAIYGHFGDTRGRRVTLLMSVIAIGLPSFCLGLLPTYHSIGLFAPACLIILRLIQGLSAGGELGGSITYLVEMAPSGKSGFYGAMSIASAMSGVLLAALAAALLTSFFTQSEVSAYAWRIPFLCSVVVVCIAAYFRIYMFESPVFKSMKETNFMIAAPVKRLLAGSFNTIFKSALAVCLGGVINFAFVVYMPIYLHLYRHFPAEICFSLSVMSLAVVIVLSLLTGYLTRFVSRRWVMISVCCFILIFGWFIAHLIEVAGLPAVVFAVLVMACFQGIFFGAQMTYLVELFPSICRYSGVSIGYNIGYALFAGFTPFILDYFIQVMPAAMAFYSVLAGGAIFSLLGLLIGKRKNILLIPGLCFGERLFSFQKDYFQDTVHCKTYLIEHNCLHRNIEKIAGYFPGEEFMIVAHSSLGAGVALAAAAELPQRIKKVICFPGWVKPNDFTVKFLEESLQQVANGQFSAFKQTLAGAAISEAQVDRHVVLRRLRDEVQNAIPINQAMRQIILLKDHLDITSYLKKIIAEVLVVLNIDNDPWFAKEEAIQLSEALQFSRHVAIDNTGHLAPYTSEK